MGGSAHPQWLVHGGCMLHPPSPAPHHCSIPDCKGNYLEFYKDSEGQHCKAVLAHFKNEDIKGPQVVPIAKSMLPMLVALERAAAHHTPATKLLFCYARWGVHALPLHAWWHACLGSLKLVCACDVQGWAAVC